ncbi:hypothetical protein LG202_22850 [Methylobacillus methanolivorans]
MVMPVMPVASIAAPLLTVMLPVSVTVTVSLLPGKHWLVSALLMVEVLPLPQIPAAQLVLLAIIVMVASAEATSNVPREGFTIR